MSSDEDQGDVATVTSLDELRKWKVKDLKSWLHTRGHPHSGTKEILTARVHRGMLGDDTDCESTGSVSENADEEEGDVNFEDLQEWHLVTDHDIPNLRWEDIDNYFLYGRNRVSGRRRACRRMLKKAKKFAWEPEFFHPIQCHSDHQDFVFFKALVRASMKQTQRLVEVTLVKSTGAILKTCCPCKAGSPGYCSHAGAMLLKLAALCTPCTSKLCSWSQPQNLAKNFMPRVLPEIPFGDPEKQQTAPQHAYPGVHQSGPSCDPEAFLQDMLKGLEVVNPSCVLYQHLCSPVSLCTQFTQLFQIKFCISDLVDLSSCKAMFEDYKKNLHVTKELVELVENGTRGQSSNPQWREIRQYILTASNFGSVMKLKESTGPENIMSKLRGYKTLPPIKALEYGRNKEAQARREYVQLHKKECGGDVDVRGDTGLAIDESRPFLGASLDGLVNCTSCGKGALEIKCPYKYRHVKPHDIRDSTFCSENVAGNLVLKKNHNYYYQVQGQMGVAKLPWADFLIWTPVGCSVERVRFDENLWAVMVSSLTSFYVKNFVAELFSLRVKRGKRLYPQSLTDN